MGGSSPTATPVQVAPPIYPPGYGFSEAFFGQVLPQLMNAQFPRFTGSVDPGLSPTMAATLRGAQTFAGQPFSPEFNQAGSTLGGLMNVNYENPMASVDPNRYGFDYTPDDFRSGMQAPKPGLPASPQQATRMMAPSFGAAPNGAGAPAGGKSPQADGRATGNAASPFPIGNPTESDPRAPGSRPISGHDPNQPLGPISRPTDPNQFAPGAPTSGGGGGAGGAPGSGNSSPPSGGAPPAGGGMPNIPDWLKPILLSLGLNVVGGGSGSGGGANFGPFNPSAGKPATPDLDFGGLRPYQPISGGQGFVDYNPGSPQINMVRGLQAGSSYGNPMPPGPIGSPPGTPPSGAPPPASSGLPPGYDPNGVVPGNQLEFFGQWRGPNKGKSMDEIYRDNYERGWDYGPNFVKREGWGERGSRPTTWAEARMKNPNAGMGPAPAAPPLAGGPPVSTTDPRRVAGGGLSGSGAPAGGK